ncbi:MAG: RIP metalloprotease RseP [Bdellovibrionales bacterium]|nr:RIP metalloprotease RseP [Bdellovibrionales bacterium]
MVLLSILGFVCILGPLVVVHEFGHYFFARIFGVKAEVFSVGFGRKIWSRKRGETEWCLSIIPLGGYVKLLGEEPGQELPPEIAHRSLQRQDRWKRFFIFFGGPLFNFIFAALVFMAIQVIGEEQVASRIGRVLPGTAAAVAGLKSGDKLLEIDGKALTKYEEIDQILLEKPERLVALKVERPGVAAPLSLMVKTEKEAGYSHYGERTHVGTIPGILPVARDGTVGISDPQSIAGRAGVKTGDQAKTWNGAPVSDFERLEELYTLAKAGESISLGIQSGSNVITVSFTKPSDGKDLAAATGVHSSELFIEKTLEKSPAEKIGLKKGDRLIAINGTAVRSFFELREKVQKAGESLGKATISWERDGRILQEELTPSERSVRDAELGNSREFTIGIYPMLSTSAPEVVIERTLNPLVVTYQGFSKMVTFSWRNIVSIGKMFVGDVSMKTLGGPILIGKIAGESMSRGLITFLTTMAILSIGLGVLNVLPIPVLDGGHILLLGVEAIRGKPLQMRQLEIVQQVGLALILILMVVVMKNDLVRVFGG